MLDQSVPSLEFFRMDLETAQFFFGNMACIVTSGHWWYCTASMHQGMKRGLEKERGREEAERDRDRENK